MKLKLAAVPDDAELDALLKRVSRSFYLSLAILPRAVRAQISIAYLIARAADTIADTEALPAALRLTLLDELRQALRARDRVVTTVGEVRRVVHKDAPPSERQVLEQLGDALRRFYAGDPSDKERIRSVLDTLFTGMERDLTRFPQGALNALETLDALDEHCYYAAGCVGEFWTRMISAHIPTAKKLGRPDLMARGVRLGKALQMVNVLRDAPSDLANGRCYWPTELLAQHGLSPSTLRSAGKKARPVIDNLIDVGLAHVDAAFPYVLTTPRTQVRLRLAALWPLWIGLDTLRLIRQTPDPLAQPVKIQRAAVYGAMTESLACVGSNQLLEKAHARRRALV